MKKFISLFLAVVLLITSGILTGCKIKDPNSDTDQKGDGKMTLYDLRTDDLRDPVGIDSETPDFSWKMESDVIGQKQTAYRIVVKNGDATVWDSGKVESSDSVDIRYAGETLESSTEYKWQLTVWDKDGKEKSTSATFETGLYGNKAFSDAKWISCDDSSLPEDTTYTIDFDFVLDKSSTGFCFGATDANNLFMWQINTVEVAGDPLLLRPHIKTGGSWSVLGQYDISGALGMSGSQFIGKKMHERISVDGKKIETYIGTSESSLVLVNSYTYSSKVPLNLIGFRHHADSAEAGSYDNIVIKNKDGEIIYSNDFSSGDIGFSGSSYAEISGGMLKVSAPSGSGEQTALQIPENNCLPAYRKSFTPAKKLVSAKLYTSALGVYESYINGQRVGRKYADETIEYHELKPGFTEASDRKFYNSYDVTWMIGAGSENVLSAVVTSGWWSGRVAASYGKETAYLAKMILKYSDGSEEVIVTDKSWKAAKASAVSAADIFDGESYDARVDQSWMLPGFDDSEWSAVKLNREFSGEICSWVGSYITVRDDLERSAQSVTIYNGATGSSSARSEEHTSVTIYNGATGSSSARYGKIKVTATYDKPVFTLKPGETALIDFGQNFAGWEAFTLSGAAGTVITIEHGEILNDNNGEKSRGNDGPGGSIYNANYRSAAATTKYTLRGGGDESYHPSFTFYGFRYIEITTTAEVTFKRVVGQVVTSVEDRKSVV